jgi:hypothetical protein
LHSGLELSTGDWPSGIVVADVNRDRKLDIATSSPVAYSHYAAVLLGNGDGTFQPKIEFTVGDQGYGYDLAAADLNNDRYPELIATGSFWGSIQVLTNDTNWPSPLPPFGSGLPADTTDSFQDSQTRTYSRDTLLERSVRHEPEISAGEFSNQGRGGRTCGLKIVPAAQVPITSTFLTLNSALGIPNSEF